MTMLRLRRVAPADVLGCAHVAQAPADFGQLIEPGDWSSTMRFIALVSALAVLPTTAGAQPVDSFRQLKGLIELGEDVTVVHGFGQVVEGRALDISSSTLTLMVAGAPLELDEAAVRRVSQRWRDSTRDGARIGFAVGAAPWWVLYLVWAQAEAEPLSVKGFAILALLSGATGTEGCWSAGPWTPGGWR